MLDRLLGAVVAVGPGGGPGRRWEPVAFLVTEPSLAPGKDRIAAFPPAFLVLERAYQYRVIFDHGRDAWRVDVRVDAPSGGGDSAARQPTGDLKPEV